MSDRTATAAHDRRGDPGAPAAASTGLRFDRVLRSEWIKLRSLRSTVWSFVIILVIQLAFGILIALTTTASGQGGTDVGRDLAVTAAGVGLISGQLVIAIQGVLLMSGEFSTGQILSSLAAVPRRLPVLWAKAAVFGAVTLAAGMAGIVLTFFVTAPILSGAGFDIPLWNGELWLRLAGGAAYLAFIGVISLGIGVIVRVPAGGIATAMGLILVLPSVLPLFGAGWATDLMSWLPGVAGQQLFFWGSSPVPSPFEPWQALLVMVGWTALALAGAAVLLRRRDA